MVDILKQRQAVIADDARRVEALFEEERVLKKTADFYTESDGDRSAHAAEFLEELNARIAAISDAVDSLLPSYDENRLIGNLLLGYDRENSAIEPDVRTALRRNQRAMLARYLDAQKRLEEDQRRREVESGPSYRYRSDMLQREIAAANRNRLIHGGNAVLTSSEGTGKTSTAVLMSDVKPSNVLSIGASAMITAAQNADVPKGKAADELGSTVAEFMTRSGVTEIAFTDLYNQLRPLLIEQSASPNEKARIENFRYHLRMAGKRYGFRYERGRVILGVSPTPAIEGGEVAHAVG